ncbi:hypothetical protein ACQEVG_14320 [Streptomyces sp. CA-135486]|uniref:hypothetical protein n=1 Tax=Streptomyces sp. CA-135486 TaxID=3240049 RepID=UPI003D8E4020
MTEVAPEGVDESGWEAPERDAAVSYPESPANPHNHRYTLSYDPQKPPFLVVRASTIQELQDAFQELEEGGVYAAMGNAWRVMKAQASVGAGLGPTTPVSAPPAAVQPVPLPQAPQAQYPQPAQTQPGVPGTAPAQWQNVGAPPPPPPAQGGFNGGSGNRAEPKPRPPWPQVFRISIARGDTSFKDYRAANQQYFKGKVAWAGGGDYWIHGEVVQSVAQWNPVPA